MIFCPNDHRYDARRRWCPHCGKPNPVFTAKKESAKPKTECAVLFHKVPKELRKRFKRACFVKSTSMRQEVLNFMERFATENGYPYDLSSLPGERPGTRPPED